MHRVNVGKTRRVAPRVVRRIWGTSPTTLLRPDKAWQPIPPRGVGVQVCEYVTARGDRLKPFGGQMLSRVELRSLIEAVREASCFLSGLRLRCPMAKHVQYPKIPTVLSESLAVYAINNGLLLASVGPFRRVERGGREADIIAVCDDGRRLKIETKASGEKNFATFGAKDYCADYLLWMLFGSLLRENAVPRIIEVLVCPSPAEHLPWWKQHKEEGKRLKDRVTVAQLTKDWQGGGLQRVKLDLDRILK